MPLKIRVALMALGAATAVVSFAVLGAADRDASAEDASSKAMARVLGPGLVEPLSEEIALGVEVPGRIAALLADEGDAIRAGQVLARLDARDSRAQVASAEARLTDARAALTRVRNGSRPEERREARAAVAQARFALAQAEREAARRDALVADGVISREEQDRARRDVDVARARLAELSAHQALVEAGPRAEEHTRAEAVVALAEAGLREARARLAKTEIVSPIDGVVLRRDVRAGETVSPEIPGTTLFIVADVSRLRVRVEVDERDVGRLRLGQHAWVTAAAYRHRRFAGRVVQIGRMLGRKSFQTNEPRERVDTKVLETLVELDPDARLPIGLRVDATLVVDD